MHDKVRWKPDIKHPAVIEPGENSITRFAPYIQVELREGDWIVKDGDRYIVIPEKMSGTKSKRR